MTKFIDYHPTLSPMPEEVQAQLRENLRRRQADFYRQRHFYRAAPIRRSSLWANASPNGDDAPQSSARILSSTGSR